MAQVSDMLVEIRECDGAAANGATLKAYLAKKPEGTVIFWMLCNMHQLALCSGNVLRTFGIGKLEVISCLYSAALSMRVFGSLRIPRRKKTT